MNEHPKTSKNTNSSSDQQTDLKKTARKKTNQVLIANQPNDDEPIKKKLKKENSCLSPILKQSNKEINHQSSSASTPKNTNKKLDTIVAHSAPSISKDCQNAFDRWMYCGICNNVYDSIERLPKIVCNNLTACSICVNKNVQNKWFKCNLCDSNHSVSSVGFPSNPIILDLLKLKPIKINNDSIGKDFLFDLKLNKLIDDLQSDLIQIDKIYDSTKTDFNHFLDKIKILDKENVIDFIEKLKKNINNFKHQIIQTNANTKSDLDKLLDANKTTEEEFSLIDSNLDEIEEIFEESKSIDSTSQITDLKFNFNEIRAQNSLNSFYPLNRKKFFSIVNEKESEKNIKLRISSEYLKILNETDIKIDQFEFLNSICENEILNSYFIDKQNMVSYIVTYEMGKKFHKIKKLNSKNKLVYVSSTEIMLYCDKKGLITVFDHTLSKTGNFGQSEDENGPFYLKKRGFEIVFANAHKIVLLEKEKSLLKIYSRSLGKCIKYFKLDSSYLDKVFVDKNTNVILINKVSKKVKIFEDNGIVLKEIDIDFSFDFDRCVITSENEIAFVYYSKNVIKFLKI